MTGIEIVAKLAELKQQYDDAHRPVRSVEQYRQRHARRHPGLHYDGECHVSQYRCGADTILRVAALCSLPLSSAVASR